ncbi:hypothetical protein CRG98_006339 [Punica granatum]|uniref:Uncharacterized protein n=1 Tax=Punica granatum TaxID=22663 RepID=A0A2I0KXR4_PUNGR|nr:hypothetical protein CRG98_006339 [Punica granatum]
MLGCKGMHVRGARRTGRAAGGNGRDAGARQTCGARGRARLRNDPGYQSSKLIDKQYRDDLGYARYERSTVGMIPAVKVVNSRNDPGYQSSKLIDKQYRDDLGYARCERSTDGMIPAVNKQYRDDLGYARCERSTVGMIPTVKVMRKVNSRDDPGCQSSKLIYKQYRDDLGYARCERSTDRMIPAVDKQYRDDLGYARCERKRRMTLVVCGCKAAVLRIGLTLGTATRLVAWESENRGWFTRKGRHNSPLVVILEHAECPWGRG